MGSRINKTDAWYIGAVMACGFITFYPLPDDMPFLVRLTIMVLIQLGSTKRNRMQNGNQLMNLETSATDPWS